MWKVLQAAVPTVVHLKLYLGLWLTGLMLVMVMVVVVVVAVGAVSNVKLFPASYELWFRKVYVHNVRVVAIGASLSKVAVWHVAVAVS